MVRKLALAVSIALGTLNVPAHALGLGELTSKSLLNQNFNGDITLLSVTPEEIDGIRVKLADAEAFSRAGVERPFYLSLLRFEPVLGGSGKPVIRVSSDFPIREPFLNFLVEVNWPNGRLLREYTVLLDPPTTTTRRPPAAAAPEVATRPAARPPVQRPVTRPAPAQAPAAPAAPTVSRSTAGEYGPVQANETAWSIARKLLPAGVSMEQMMMALLAANPQAFVDNNINRLRQGRILRVPALDEIQQLSRQAARQAYRDQQDQWLARRDARLQESAAADATVEDAAVTGETDDQLRIATPRPDGEGEAGASEDDATQPTSGDLQSRLIVARENAETSRQEAETLRSQVDDLQQRLADMQRLLSLKDDQLAQLQDQVASGEEPAAAGESVLEQVADEPVAATDDMATEAAVADTTETSPPEEAETLVEAPAETAADALDEVLADLESAAEPVAPATIEADAPEVTGIVNALPDFVPPPGYQIPDVTPLVDVDAIVEGRADVTAEPAAQPRAEIVAAPDVTGLPGGETELVIEGDVGAAEPAPAAPEPAEPVATDEPAASEPEPAVVAEPEAPAQPAILPPALASLVEKNIVPLAGGGVALVGLIGWLATRRRKQEAAAPAGAPLPAADDANLPGVDEPSVSSEALNDLPDSAFLDEFSPNDISSLQDETGEVDPVSEADVYIAYGRYQQAQELLRQAMERDPGRLALKHKLLEVHYATRDGDAFAELAQEMVDAGQDAADETAWARAQDMGRELQPANPLFAAREDAAPSKGAAAVGAGAAAGAAGVAAAAATTDFSSPGQTVDDDTLSIGDLDLSDLDEEYEISKPGDEPLDAPSEVSITLDLDDTTEDLTAADSDIAIPDIPESISLDEMESLELEDLEKAAAPQADAVDGDTVSDSFDLDSMMKEAEAAIDTEDTTLNLDSEFSADELQAELDQLSDLSVLDSGLDEAAAAAEAGEEPAANLGLVEEDATRADAGVDQPIDLDQALATEEVSGADSEVLDLDAMPGDGEEDDVSTKLDLARAYVEMGDQDGARSILEEVVSEGNEGQKDEAQKLLADIG